MKKRYLSILLVALLLMALLPVTALASDDVATVTVGGVELSAAAPYWKNGDAAAATGTAEDYNVYFDASTGVLTLKNAVISGAFIGYMGSGYEYSCGIYVLGDVTLELVGTNVVTGLAKEISYGILVEGALSITGSGTLTATGAASSRSSCGILSFGEMAITASAAVTAIGGTGSGSYGLEAMSALTISDRATLTATADDASDVSSAGVSAGSQITIKDSASVTATGGAAGYNSYGIYIAGDDGLVISTDASVTAVGGSGYSSFGIYSEGYYAPSVCAVSAGKVTAVGGAATFRSAGIYINGSVELSGSADVTAQGGKSDEISCGVLSFGSLTDEEAKVTLTGAAALTAVGSFAGVISAGVRCAGAVSVGSDAAKLVAVGAPGSISHGIYKGSDSAQVIYGGGLLVAASGKSAGEASAMDVAPTGSALAAATVTGSADGNGSYYVASPMTDGIADYAVFTENVTNETEDLSGHLVWAANGTDLALTNTVVIGAVDALGNAIALSVPAGGTLTCEGFNLLLAGDSGDGYAALSDALHGEGELSVTGSGALTAVGGWGKFRSCGIYAEALTLQNASVTAVSGAGEQWAFGLRASTGSVRITSGDLTAIGEQVSGSYNSSALDAQNSSVDITDSAVTLIGGLYCGSCAISGSTVTALGNQTPGDSVGIYCKDALSITAGSTVTALGGRTASESIGIRAGDELTISDSTVTALGNHSTARWGSSGIHSYSPCTISHSTVTAVGGQADHDNSYGFQGDSQLRLSDSAFTALGGKATGCSYGISESYDDYGDWEVAAGESKTMLLIENSAAVVAVGGSADERSYGISANYYDGRDPAPSEEERREIILIRTGSDLTALGGSAAQDSYGIDTNENATISGASVTALGGSAGGADAESAGYISTGLCVVGAGATLTVTGSTLTARGGSVSVDDLQSERSSVGVYGDIVDLSSSVIDASAASANFSMGLAATERFTLASGSVTALGGPAVCYSVGLLSCGDLLTTGGDLTATGGAANEAGGESMGLYGWSTLCLQGGSVTAVGGPAASFSAGVYTLAPTARATGSDAISLEGADLTAVGGALAGEQTISCGMWSSNVAISAGSLSATGGVAAVSLGVASTASAPVISGGAGTVSGSAEATNKRAFLSEPAFSNVVTFGTFAQQNMSWRAATHTVTFDAQNGSAATQNAVSDNTAVTRPADPVWTGYAFAGWYLDAACTEAWDFSTAVIEDVTLYAKWTPVYCTLTSSAGAGGSISPLGAVSVQAGANQTFTVTPQTGYEIADVLVDGVSVKDKLISGSYTFENVTAAHTIAATFAVKSPATGDTFGLWQYMLSSGLALGAFLLLQRKRRTA